MVGLAIFTSVMLIAAALSGLVYQAFPYGAYTLLRIIVCSVSGIMAIKLFAEKDEKEAAEGLAWVMILAAVVFNPIVPFALGKAVWFVVDIIAAGFILAAAAVTTANAKVIEE